MRRRKSILNIPHPPKSVTEKAHLRLEGFTTWPTYEFFGINKYWTMLVSIDQKTGNKVAELYRVRNKVGGVYTDLSKKWSLYNDNLYPAEQAKLMDILNEDWHEQLAERARYMPPEAYELQGWVADELIMEEREQNKVDYPCGFIL